MLNDLYQKSETPESLIFMIMYYLLQTHQEVGKCSHLHYYVVCFLSFGFVSP